MGIVHHLTVIATDGGLEKAEAYLEGREITSREEKQVDSLREYMGRGADRFKTYFMDGAKKEERVIHPATGTEVSFIYS